MSLIYSITGSKSRTPQVDSFGKLIVSDVFALLNVIVQCYFNCWLIGIILNRVLTQDTIHTPDWPTRYQASVHTSHLHCLAHLSH